jgi:hypothetical protein
MNMLELQRVMRTVDPAAVLVSPRVLEGVAREKSQLSSLTWSVPHAFACVTTRQVLFRHVEQDELDLQADELLPDVLHLIVRPEREEFDDLPQLLLKYWRLLFHVQVHGKLEATPGTADDWQRRAQALGAADFAEIRAILAQDHLVAPTADTRDVFIEFASTFLEYHHFAPSLIPSFFPRIQDPAATERLLRADVDGDAIKAATRLPGAPDSERTREHLSDEANEYYWKLLDNARADEGKGNLVKAMILLRKATRVAPSDRSDRTRDLSLATLRALLLRLQPALEIPDEQLAEWDKVLAIVLDRADQGSRAVEASILYDLQKICLDFEKEIYALDVMEWALSGGHRPIKRPLPGQRIVRITMQLRAAARRVQAARLSDADRLHLSRLVKQALDRCHQRLVVRFRPILVAALHDVGLVPSNPPEQAAFEKITAELLERIVDNGFFTFGELRDVISRNQLKLPDLESPHDFKSGDALLRLDRRLSNLLDGVYRPSEVYLRVLERFTALNFGTKLGRAITLFLTLPFGGAFLLWKLFEIILEKCGVPDLPLSADLAGTFALGTVLYWLIHSPDFRQVCRNAAWQALVPLRFLFHDLPLWVAQHPVMKLVGNSWTFQLFVGYALQPLLACGLIGLAWPEVLYPPLQGAVIFIVVALVLSARVVQSSLRMFGQALQDLARLIRSGLFLGLLRLVVSFFRQVMHGMETVLFTVDEWLRFRSDENWLTMVLRALLNLLWYPVSYFARFYLVVLVEPMLNPLKLPVTSIAAKFMLPFNLILTRALAEVLTPFLGTVVANLFAGTTVFLLPDAFGFLFWEMKENWNLYRSNRPASLRPATIGSHGETLAALLQPGFHSGTIPKLFARIRQASRRAYETGNARDLRTSQERLDEIREVLNHFVNAELIALVQQARSWKELRLRIHALRIASQRIRIELALEPFPGEILILDFEESAGWLTARISQRGWLDGLTNEQQRAFNSALVFLYKQADVHLVLEQWRKPFPWPVDPFLIADDWLHLRGGPDGATEVKYPLTALSPLRPQSVQGLERGDWPALPSAEVLFSQQMVPWESLVGNWRVDQEGKEHPALVVDGRAIDVLGGNASSPLPLGGAG